jgi:hypothetical protein
LVSNDKARKRVKIDFCFPSPQKKTLLKDGYDRAQRDICFLHASSSKNDAEKEINLYQHLVLATKKNMNSESKTISSKSNALAQKKAAVRPTNRTALNTKDATRAPRSSQLV